MDFALSEEVELFRDSVHRWVDQECPKDWCRELERQEHVYPQELWDKLAEAGFHGVGIPEEYDGLGGDIVVQATFMREFARNAAGLSWIWELRPFQARSR
jgi:butyryl-CoA dehydrogenase